jgi:hypothetical protein
VTSQYWKKAYGQGQTRLALRLELDVRQLTRLDSVRLGIEKKTGSKLAHGQFKMTLNDHSKGSPVYHYVCPFTLV